MPACRTLWLIVALCASGRAQEVLRVGPLDSAHLNGITFIADNQSLFAVRVLVYRRGEKLEDVPPLRRLSFGSLAADGSYARLRWPAPFAAPVPLTLRWSRIRPHVVIAEIAVEADVRVALETYAQLGAASAATLRAGFQVQDLKTLVGERVGRAEAQFNRFLLRADTTAGGGASYNDAAAMRALLVREGRALPLHQSSADAFAPQAFGGLSFELKELTRVGFVALVGDDLAALEKEADEVLREPIRRQLAESETDYLTTRTASDGRLGDGFEALTREVNWNRVFLPEAQLSYVAALHSPARIVHFNWDGFFRAVTASLINGFAATDTIRALLAGQTADGRVAARFEHTTQTGRSMPPVGAFATWKVYLATRDSALLAWAYPRLKRWHEWWFAKRGDGRAWRDGNGDGLLESGFDAALEHGELGARRLPLEFKTQAACFELGFEDVPPWLTIARAPASEIEPANDDAVKFNEAAHTLEFSPVGLNALYALDTEMLGLMARELGLKEDAEKFEQRYAQLRRAVEEKLWSEQDGLYLNRHWDGRWSRRVTPENFYVLAAGIPDRARAERLLAVLRDPQKFGGEFALPSLARDDAAFKADGAWRGRIHAPLNYLVYVGLKRYGCYAEAAELARRSTAVAHASWWRDWRVYDSFSSADGGSGAAAENGGRLSFGALLWLPGIEELIGVDPWSDVSIGNEAINGQSGIERLQLADAVFDVVASPRRLLVRRDGKPEIEFDRAVRLRGYRGAERTLSFFIETAHEVEVRVPPVVGREISVSVDGKIIDTAQPGTRARFKIQAGIHRVVIVK